MYSTAMLHWGASQQLFFLPWLTMACPKFIHVILEIKASFFEALHELFFQVFKIKEVVGYHVLYCMKK